MYYLKQTKKKKRKEHVWTLHIRNDRFRVRRKRQRKENRMAKKIISVKLYIK